MGQIELNLKTATDCSDRDLEKQIGRRLRLKNFTYIIIKKSLDSRKKNDIHWQHRILVSSGEIRENSASPFPPALEIPRVSGGPKAVIAGTGPAGIFAGLFLQKAGFRVTLLERGKDVDSRAFDIDRLEREEQFTEDSNYSFGEGGAGTFSDGKLTSRSKHIKRERRYILDEFVRHGAPEEILYLAHPHIGSDKLMNVAQSMRSEFESLGGKIAFSSRLEDLDIKDGRVRSAYISGGGSVTGGSGSQELKADYFILATGHSALDTFRMLIDHGVPYRPKNFALGFRMEHSQERINRIQWGCPSLEGVKAAEYRLTSGKAELPVYSFCMCPGGKVVPAAAFGTANIVNGMSYYDRNGPYANAAFVAGVPPQLIEESLKSGNPLEATDSLDWLENLEQSFFSASGGYRAPAMTIRDFLNGRSTGELLPSSYKPGLTAADLGNLLPPAVTEALRLGMADICRRMPGWDEGQIMGLESKTSSPVQVLRNSENGLTDGFSNLFICGEASGWSGGIISSASDGLKTAMSLCSHKT